MYFSLINHTVNGIYDHFHENHKYLSLTTLKFEYSGHNHLSCTYSLKNYHDKPIWVMSTQ